MLHQKRIDALAPKGSGHSFVFYGDACSGVPGAPHEATLAKTNEMVANLSQTPEFVIFAGDEIIGLTTDETALRRQWRYWLDVEMAWLNRAETPLYNTTSNHTTYNKMSERVFADVLDHLPHNGPDGQHGLSYFVRQDDLLLVFVNTCHTELGGEGHVETDWLSDVLTEHADARFSLVVGHHPVFPVNGFSGEYQRELGPAAGQEFWDVLVRHEVFAYLCSHILAFDVQVNDGVLQVCSAGAGTAYRMPPEVEYLHFVQAAIDDDGLRYQVIDQDGEVRERLAWPPKLPPSDQWVSTESMPAPDGLITWRLRGIAADDTADGSPQTLLVVSPEGLFMPSLWIGMTGIDQRLTVTISQAPGRSPHYWFGPALTPGQPFDFQLLLHGEMGPGVCCIAPPMISRGHRFVRLRPGGLRSYQNRMVGRSVTPSMTKQATHSEARTCLPAGYSMRHNRTVSTMRLMPLLVLVLALITSCSSEPLPEAIDVGFDCRGPIEQLSELPDGYRSVLDLVAFPEIELHQQGRSEEIEAGSGVLWRFSKMGLLIRRDSGFTLRVAEESRGNALISWSNTGSPGPVEGLVTDGCSGDEAWLVYPGGVWVIDPACVTLTVEAEGNAESVSLPIAQAC